MVSIQSYVRSCVWCGQMEMPLRGLSHHQTLLWMFIWLRVVASHVTTSTRVQPGRPQHTSLQLPLTHSRDLNVTLRLYPSGEFWHLVSVSSSRYLKPIWCLNPDLQRRPLLTVHQKPRPSADSYYDLWFQLQTLNVPSKLVLNKTTKHLSVRLWKPFVSSMLRTNVCVTPLFTVHVCACAWAPSILYKVTYLPWLYTVTSHLVAMADSCWRIYWQSVWDPPDSHCCRVFGVDQCKVCLF